MQDCSRIQEQPKNVRFNQGVVRCGGSCIYLSQFSVPADRFVLIACAWKHYCVTSPQLRNPWYNFLSALKYLNCKMFLLQVNPSTTFKWAIKCSNIMLPNHKWSQCLLKHFLLPMITDFHRRLWRKCEGKADLHSNSLDCFLFLLLLLHVLVMVVFVMKLRSFGL